MQKLAVLFSGQGSQYPLMGLDYLANDTTFKEQADQASRILGFDVIDVLKDETGLIHQTKYTQPLTLLTTLWQYQTFLKLGVKVDAYLGFSLGEYAAYFASGIFEFETLFKTIKKRSEAMQACAIKHKGSMVAVLGMQENDVIKLCELAQKEGTIIPANFNAPGQIVLSGEEKAVDFITEHAKAHGAKRAIKLSVSGAFHSPLMHDAAEELKDYLNNVHIESPKTPLYFNLTAQKDVPKDLKSVMSKHIESPVLFEQSIQNMIHDGITHFIEIGPGAVLTGLVRKIHIDTPVTHLDKLEELEDLKGWLKTYEFTR
jgi:[acyl-carrier-protein] S-malonyltransferase